MKQEVERKFRITYLPKRVLKKGVKIRQGYLSLKPEVRVRLVRNRAYITIKSTGALVRKEFEYRIPLNDARRMLAMCQWQIDKTRYRVGRAEVDVYHGPLQGLIIAEIEMQRPSESTQLPQGIQGYDVTRDKRYKNKNLSKSQKVPHLSHKAGKRDRVDKT